MKLLLSKLILITALLGTVMTTALPHGSEGLVLCQGEDGHFEIELAQDGKCTECLIPEDDHHDESALASDEHCGSCVDTVLLQNSRVQARQRIEQTQVVQAGALPAIQPVEPKWREPLLVAGFPQPPPAPSAARLSLRTIRLII